MRILRIIILLLAISLSTQAQDTFSIVAVDTATGEIGSAGASCIANSFIISGLIQGVGVFHTQAAYLPGNQQNGYNFMEAGESPDQMIKSLKQSDVGGDSTVRQYGIAVLKPGIRTAAYTGKNCMDYKNHIIRPTYTIQGNILLGQHVLDSMEARFLREPRSLAYKMMAALQGANIPGADSRCLTDNKPAISAFIRLSRATDSNDVDYMVLNVSNTKASQNPIDSLQKRFDKFIKNTTDIDRKTPVLTAAVFPNPTNDKLTIRYFSADNRNAQLSIYNIVGKMVYHKELPQGNEYSLSVADLEKGLYFYAVKTNTGSSSGKLIVQ